MTSPMWYPFSNQSKSSAPKDLPSLSAKEQIRVENHIYAFLRQKSNGGDTLVLNRAAHIQYARKGINHLDRLYQSLDASRPWLVYWNLHSLELLGEPIPQETATKNRVYDFLLSVKQCDGSFVMHEGGETDIRGVYCAAAVASILNINTPILFDSTAQWIISCQTYEGGFSGAKDVEAHGGYTFCGLAALVLLGHPSLIDLKSLIRWISNRQMKFEGGFSGRANKLVDGCYSFWVGACFAICRQIYADDTHTDNDVTNLGNREAIQHYILQCCQDALGGCVDKPGKHPDFYHTCYVLSGLSIAQNHMGKGQACVVGNKANLLTPTHPVYNICMHKEQAATTYFKRLPQIE